MVEELKKAVAHLSEEESKLLLLRILNGVDVLEKQQFVNRIQNVQQALLHKFDDQPKQQATSCHTAHFTFSRSASGTLSRALKQMHKDSEEKVISFADLFSIGPIEDLQKQNGFVKRYNWLQDKLHHECEELDNFFNHYTEALLALKRISETISVVIWCGDNAHEQTGLAYLLYLLRDSKNNIYIMNTTELYHTVNPLESLEEIKHTGQIPVEAYKVFNEQRIGINPLTERQREEYELVWEGLTTTNGVLRIMEDGRICTVAEDYYDAAIIEAARKLQSAAGRESLPSARLIGEVVGHINQYIGDSYLEYRLRYLIEKGVFEIASEDTGMRYYKIKLC